MTSPRNATTNRDGSRYYTWRDERYHSVTTIIGNALAKPALIGWAKKFTAEYAVEHFDSLTQLVSDDPKGAVDWLKGAAFRERDRKADLGSSVHAAIEAHILETPVPEWPLPIRPRMKHFEQFVADFEVTFEMAEANCFSRTHRYAGTLDAIGAVFGSRRYLLDTKCGEKGPFPDHALQLTAYRHSDFLALPDGSEVPTPAVDACAVLKLTDAGYELHEVESGEDVFKFFLYLQQVFRFIVEYAPHAVGPALAAEQLRAAIEQTKEAA